MSDNDRVLLDQLFTEFRTEHSLNVPQQQAFELFACEQVMRTAELTHEEVRAGVVGGGGDGGIDGAYTFVDGALVREDSELLEDTIDVSRYRRDIPIRLVLVQAKRESSFSEEAVDKVRTSTEQLLSLQAPVDELEALYSTDVVEQVHRFKSAVRKLLTRHPTIAIEFIYATRGDIEDVHPNVKTKAEQLECKFQLMFGRAIGIVSFRGARELVEYATSSPSHPLQLVTRDYTSSVDSYLAFVALRDYLNFLREKDGTLRRNVFDWNVRDFEGHVQVNQEMRSSLADRDAPDFWWLNNGITILCSRASIQGRVFALDNVQIVNGLQTSYTIHEALHATGQDEAVMGRLVVVRILVTEDAEIRDKVIRATNRQTRVPEASLRATDSVQRRIETYFVPHGWYYDRRKNYNRNLGRPPGKIVGIPFMAQIIMAIGLSRPDDARARPTSLLKNETDYNRLFSDEIPLAVYLWGVKVQKGVDAFLQSEAAATTNSERTNLRFHLATLAVARLVGERIDSPKRLVELASQDRDISEAGLPNCLEFLRATMSELVQKSGESEDKIAKSRKFVDRIFESEIWHSKLGLSGGCTEPSTCPPTNSGYH